MKIKDPAKAQVQGQEQRKHDPKSSCSHCDRQVPGCCETLVPSIYSLPVLGIKITASTMFQGSHGGPTHLVPTSSSLRIDGSPTQTFHRPISDTLMPLIYECHTISQKQVQNWLLTHVPTPPAVSGRSIGRLGGACYRSHIEGRPCGANRDWEGHMTGERVGISPSQLQPGLRHHALVSGPG